MFKHIPNNVLLLILENIAELLSKNHICIHTDEV